MSKWVRAIMLAIFFSGLWGAVQAQNKDAIFKDFLRAVGETDTTTGAGRVTGAIARTWMNEFFRKAAYYGVFMKETSYVAAAGLDSFRLPGDYLFPHNVRKTIAGRPHDMYLSDSAYGAYTRTDTVVLSTTKPDNALTGDVGDVITCYKKNATDKVIRPLIKVSPDSLEKVGRALLTRSLPPAFLSERIDTLIASATQPINLLRSDVFDVRAAYRKESGTGKLLPVVQVTPDSLQKIGTNPFDYFYFSGQPTPRFVLGQKKSFADSIFIEVLVASDFYSFSPFPFPTLTMGKIPSSADSCFCLVSAILPRYLAEVADTSDASLGVRLKWLRLDPAAVRADTLKLTYAAQMDTAGTAVDSVRPITSMENSTRPAISDYLKEQYYRKNGQQAEADKWGMEWQKLLITHALQRGIRIALPKN